jgi:site-specific DNA recombinase
MDVATYCRISTDEERQPFSLDAQTERLATYIAAQPEWRHVRSYTDQISGKSLDRPGLQQALGDARRGRYELLLVFKVDRLARSTGGLARVLEELDSTGVAFRSASEPFDTSTAAGRMMVQMLGVFAEFEREMIVERTKMGLAKKAASGEWTGGIAPYGYHYDTDERVLVPDEQEAANVRRVFQLYLEHQLGTASISNWMNDRSFLTRRGARWTPKKVIDVLRNPTYLGRLPFNGEVFEAAHDPIIDEGRFNQAQELLATRAQSHPDRRRNSTGYLLSSLMKCAKCGHGFIGTGAHGRGGTYRYYTCFARQRHGTARCDQDRIPADSVEEAILSVTFDALSDPSFFQEVAALARREWEQAHPGRERDLRRLAQAIDQKRASIDRYLTAFESGKLPEEACGHRVSALQREIVALETERSRLEAEYDLAPSLPTDDLLGELRAALLRASEEKAVEKLKQVLACVVDTILVEGRDHIQPYFFVPGVLTVFPSRRRTGIEPAWELSPPHRF